MAEALIKVFQKKPRLHLASFIITLFLFPTAAFNLDVLGVDPSWSLAINMAVQQDLVFGKDWIFTFGPLGYLFTRNPYEIAKWPILLYDLFVAANVYFVVFSYLQKLRSRKECLVLLIILLLLRGAWESFLLFYLLLFHLLYALKSRNLFHLLIAMVLCLLLFYVKLNLGLVAVFVFLLFLLFVSGSRRFALMPVAGIAVAFCVLTWLTAAVLDTWLPGYLKGALYLIDAYNDAMAIEDIHYLNTLLGIVLLMALLYLWPLMRYYKAILKQPDLLVLTGMVTLSLYLLLKTSFVRAHWTMLGEFHIHASVVFVYSCLFISLFYFFVAQDHPVHRYFSRYLPGALAACLLGLNVLIAGYGVNSFINAKLSLYQRNYLKRHYPELKAKNFKSHYSRLKKDAPRFIANSILYTLPYQYLKDMLSNKRQEAVARVAKKKRKLPERFLQQIGQASVDILPFEISYIYFNELNYNPRPVVQSYSAYNAWLDSVNAAKYEGATAPDYLLFQNKSIDERYPFWDETRTKLAILQHYTVADSVVLPEEDEPTLLLKKQASPLQLHRIDEPVQLSAALSDTITIPPSEDLLIMYVKISYNWWGWVKRLFYQPPALQATFIYEDGQAERFRAIVPILEGGVISNVKVSDTQAAFDFFRGDQSKQRYIRKIIFEEMSSGFMPSFDLRFEKYRLNREKEAN